MGYCDIDQLKTQIDLTLTDGAAGDVALQRIIDSVSAAIDTYCNRPDGFVASDTATARTFAGRGDPWLYIDECAAITSVAVKDSPTDDDYTAWANNDWIAFSGGHDDPDYNRTPYTGLIVDPDGTGGYAVFTSGKFGYSRGFRPTGTGLRIKPTVRVTAKWGYALIVPDDIRQACIIEAARWYKQGEGAWGDALANADLGKLMHVADLSPTVKRILARYIVVAL